jgi:hypothetical protein
MNEPGRLTSLSDSEVERILLHAGKAYRSSPEARARTMAALGLAGPLAGAAGVAALLSSAGAGAATKLAAGGWMKIVAVISLAGAATAVPVGYYAMHQRARHAAVPAAPVVVSRTAPAASPVVPAAPAAVAPVALAPEVSPVARPALAARRAARDPGLTDELAALDGARVALSSGDAQVALAALDAYTRAYPRGRLQLEAEVLSIDALARSGHTDAAKRRAQAFLRRHPKSVLAARVRGYLGD